MSISDRHRTRRRCGLLLSALWVLTACGVDVDSGPRDITDANRSNVIDPTSPVIGSTSGTDRIFLLVPVTLQETRHLRAAPRSVGTSPTARLTSLFGALSVTEIAGRLRTAIPDGLQLRSAVLQDNGTLVADVTDQLLALSSATLIDAVAQIVFTASEVNSVKRVQLFVDGTARQWPGADGKLQRQPLTVYDYPGFIESTQPDFPAVPSPSP